MESDDPDWGTGEVDTFTSKQFLSKLKNDGYKTGKVKEEENLMQKGFDVGFQQGLELGKILGNIYATARQISIATPKSILALEKLIFDEFPYFEEKFSQETIDKFQEALIPISPALFIIFLEKLESISN